MISEREKKEIDYGLFNKNNSVTTPCCKTITRHVNMRVAASLEQIESKNGIEWVYDVFGEELENRDQPIGMKLVVLGGHVDGYSCDSPVPLLVKSNYFKNDTYSSFCFCFLGLEHNPIYRSVVKSCIPCSSKCCTIDKAYFKKLERMKMYSDEFVKNKDVYLKEVKDLNLFVVKHPKVINDLLKLKEFDALFAKKVVYIAKISKFGKKLKKTKLDYLEFRVTNENGDFQDNEIDEKEGGDEEEDGPLESSGEEDEKMERETMEKNGTIQDDEDGDQEKDDEIIEEEEEEMEEEEFDVLDEPKEKPQKKTQSNNTSKQILVETGSLSNIVEEKKDVVSDEIRELLRGNSICIDASKFEMFRIWLSNERGHIIDEKLKFKVFTPTKFTGVSMDDYLSKSGVKSGDYEKMKKMPINAQIDMTLNIAYV